MLRLKLFVALVLILFSLNTKSQVSIPLIKEGKLYKIGCKLNGADLLMYFDTGASSVSLSQNEANILIKAGRLKISDIIGKAKMTVADGKVVDGTIVLIREIVIGKVVLNDIEAVIVNNQEAPLLFGQSALEKLGSFTFDYTNSTLTLNTIGDINLALLNNPLMEKDKVSLSAEKFNEKMELWKKYNSIKSKIVPYLYFENFHLGSRDYGERTDVGLSVDITNNSDLDFETSRQTWTFLNLKLTIYTKDGKQYTSNSQLANITAHSSVFSGIEISNIKKSPVVGYKVRIIDKYYDNDPR